MPFKLLIKTTILKATYLLSNFIMFQKSAFAWNESGINSINTSNSIQNNNNNNSSTNNNNNNNNSSSIEITSTATQSSPIHSPASIITTTTPTSGTTSATALSTMPVGGVQSQNPTQGLVHWMSAVMAEHMTSNSHHDPTVGMHYMWNGGVDVSIHVI